MAVLDALMKDPAALVDRLPLGGRPTGRFPVPSVATRGLRRLRRRSDRTPRRFPAVFA